MSIKINRNQFCYVSPEETDCGLEVFKVLLILGGLIPTDKRWAKIESIQNFMYEKTEFQLTLSADVKELQKHNIEGFYGGFVVGQQWELEDAVNGALYWCGKENIKIEGNMINIDQIL